jgi:gamma-glutamyltranspeptidase/glutathione hydrolase
MVRKNFGLLVGFVMILLFLYYASYFNDPFYNKDRSNYIVYSSDVVSKNGMVSSASKYASQVGIDILKRGGNAIDAAVAMGFTLTVTYPQAGNIGGGGFMLIRTKDTITSIDFREKAPSVASRDMFLDENGKFIPEKSEFGYLSIGVPGSVAGLLYALEKYGSLSRDEVMQPAVEFAQYGFVMEPQLVESLNSNHELFSKFPSTRKIFTKKKSRYSEDEVFVQKDLASTLSRIKESGKKDFYEGTTADLIVKEMSHNGGLITKEDLVNYQPIERKVVSTNYKGYDIYSMAPPSSGGVALISLLNMIEHDPDPDTLDVTFYANYEHLLIECMKRVFADRSEYLGDPDFHDIPANDLMNKIYAKERRKQIKDSSTPASEINPGLSTFYKEGNQTTHYSVIDKYGNMVSVTTTLNNWYGSFVVVEGAGFLLNDEMDDFSSKPGAPNMFGLTGNEINSIQPNKRMLSSMTPTIITKGGKPCMILGSPGGGKIISTVFETIVNVLDFKLPLNIAIDKPRFHDQWLPDYVQYEQGAFDSTIINILSMKGHQLKVVPDFGNVCGILIDWDNHTFYGHADRRGYGSAIGY